MPAFVNERPPAAWFEVHSENFLSDGGPRLRALHAIRRDYPVSCHGVGLSLGSADGLDRAHLDRLARLFDAVEPVLVSEHLSWSAAGGTYLNDLLPLPYTEEALAVVARNVDAAQAAFGRRILVENPSTYIAFAESQIAEWDFLGALVERTGCGLLFDVNNVFVSAHNPGLDAARYVAAVPAAAVGEIHLAGHTRHRAGAETVLLDDHGSRVADPVWQLYETAIARLGPVPTLIEWDTDVPALAVLLDEASRAQGRLDRVSTAPAAEPAHAG